MKLFLVSQHSNNGYDTFDAIVVAAKNADDAKTVKPLDDPKHLSGTWVSRIEDLEVIEIGTAKQGTSRSIILGSFNAG